MTESQGKLEKGQGKVREKSGNSVPKIWQTPVLGDRKHPLVVRFFIEKYRKIPRIAFFGHVTNILLAKIKKKFQGSSCPSEMSRNHFSKGGK